MGCPYTRPDCNIIENENTGANIVISVDGAGSSPKKIPQKRKITTKTHFEEKRKYATIFRHQCATGIERITYSKINKIFVEGEKYQQLSIDGTKTDYIKCCNPECREKTFENQVRFTELPTDRDY